MDRTRMLTGWQRAARKILERKQQPQALRPSSITPKEAAEMAATLQRINQRQRKKLTAQSDLVGREYGWLTPWERLPFNDINGNVPRWQCLCACGGLCEVDASSLLSGRKKHCGCKKLERRRLKAWRKSQRLAKQGRKRSLPKKFWGIKAA
jgi:hypothetical protein